MASSQLVLAIMLVWGTVSLAADLSSSSAGCGQTHTGTGALKHFSLTSSGVTRDFAVWLPANYSENSATPLILSFHGNGKDMDYQATLSRFTEPSINNDSIAVFPNGLEVDNDRCWEGAPYCTTGVSDKVFVSDLLEYMRDNYCVDNSQIYASGKSVGGGFVDVLACSPSHGGDFAAFAMDAAAIYTEADPNHECHPARSQMPILELHGTNDERANYNGDRSHGADLPNIRAVLRTWAIRNGCNTNPIPAVDRLQSNKVFYTQYDCAGHTSSVVGYNVTNQGHFWISTQYNEDNKGNTAPIDASTIMIAFFRANPKP